MNLQAAMQDLIQSYGTSEGAIKGWETRHSGMVPAESKALVSPNVREDMGFDDAVKALHSEQQAEAHSHAQATVASVAKDGTVEDAVGDWRHGAENSLSISGTMDMETARYVAAKEGLRSNQVAVAAFHDERGGPDSLWMLTVGKNNAVQQIRDTLDEHNIGHRTLVETPDGTRVEVLDKGSQLAGQIRSVAQHYETNFGQRTGRGQFIGAKTREESQPVYPRIVTAYEKKHGIRAAANRHDAPGFLDYPHSSPRQELTSSLPDLNIKAAMQDLIESVDDTQND